MHDYRGILSTLIDAKGEVMRHPIRKTFSLSGFSKILHKLNLLSSHTNAFYLHFATHLALLSG